MSVRGSSVSTDGKGRDVYPTLMLSDTIKSYGLGKTVTRPVGVWLLGERCLL